MCVTSAIMQYGQTVPINSWTTISWQHYHELLEKARKWDELAAQPHCEDPSKEKWMKAVEKRLKELEEWNGTITSITTQKDAG